MRRRETITFYLLISPWLLGFLLFVVGPMLASLGISFTRWDLSVRPSSLGWRTTKRCSAGTRSSGSRSR